MENKENSYKKHPLLKKVKNSIKGDYVSLNIQSIE